MRAAEDGFDIGEPSDEELVRSVQGGSSAAFDQLYQRHFSLAVSGARRHLSLERRFHAEDVAQITFVAVHQALARGNGPTGPFRAYLLLSIRREARRFMRRLDREANADASAAALEITTDDDLVARALRGSRFVVDDDQVVAAFRSLPPRFRDVLWRSEVLGWPPGDIGASLGLSPNAAAALSYRARVALRRSYQHQVSTD